MKKIIGIFAGAALALGVGYYVVASDHNDSPTIAGTTVDIADLYVFESPSTSSNVVFVATWQGLLAPGSATQNAIFDPATMFEFNIDTTGDNVEDLVMQCTFSNGKLQVRGPVKPASTGLNSTLVGGVTAEATITPYVAGSLTPNIGTSANGMMKIFAGDTDDPFFFDITQYKAILAGTATGFNNPGTDTFAGTNCKAVVIELPKSMISTGTINVWLEAKKSI
jgi:hypothetical protein